jgi:uncharacterized protein (DUF983 family)
MTHSALWTSFDRAARLRCPHCGRGKLFSSWFTMNERCAACGLVFEREPGYFIGAIYINYAATAVLSIAGFLLLDAYNVLSLRSQLLLWGAFGIIFPVGFFRYSRSLWLAIDHLVSPEETPLRALRKRRV